LYSGVGIVVYWPFGQLLFPESGSVDVDRLMDLNRDATAPK